MAATGFVAAVCFAAGGCAAEGDFGRPKESLLLKKITARYDRVRNLVRNEESEFPITNSEIEIRDAAYHFHIRLPRPLLRQRLASEVRWRDLKNNSDYADHLTFAGYGDGESRVAAVESQLESDHHWLKRFAFAAKEVLEADRQRTESLSERAAAYTKRDRKNTFARIEENRDIIHATMRDIDDRVVEYTYALERVRIETPGVSTAPIETALNLFRERVTYLKGAIRQYSYFEDFEGEGFHPFK